MISLFAHANDTIKACSHWDVFRSALNGQFFDVLFCVHTHTLNAGNVLNKSANSLLTVDGTY